MARAGQSAIGVGGEGSILGVEAARRNLIIQWLTRIERSELSTREFFAAYEVPFRRAQYAIYKRRFAQGGAAGLCDRRAAGGNRRLSREAEIFLAGCLRREAGVSLEWLRGTLSEAYGCDLSLAAMSRAVKRIAPEYQGRGRGRPKATAAAEPQLNPVGGFELIIAVAYHLGWPQKTAAVISGAVKNLKRTQGYKANREDVDTRGRTAGGQFTQRFNQRREVRRQRFASVTEKRQRKNWASMNIMRDRAETLERKSLAILSLPVITLNGQVRSVDVALGQALKHLCGFDYKQRSLTKYLSELKYLGVSTVLLKEVAQFWKNEWAEEQAGPVVCYYIDGNTKALWSSARVKQNKVTMLGRIMGCLEQVFIHDGLGHPMYFETFSGHGPVGEHILGLFEKIEDVLLAVPGSRTTVQRAIVMDGANNSVKMLRAFAAQDTYHYITPLDANQWDARRIRSLGRPVRYRSGAATLREVELELKDSQEPGYLVTSRAVQVEWDKGKRTVLLTSLPAQVVDASAVVGAYFKRWPAQELQFKANKAVVAFHRVVGYGRQEIPNPRVVEAQQKAAQKVEHLTRTLQAPLCEIGVHEAAIAQLIPKERRIRAQTTIRVGKRIVPPALHKQFQAYDKEIRSHQQAIKKVEKAHAQELQQLRKQQQEWLRLQGKEWGYTVDVELDQIVTFHRVSLANLYSYFIKHFLGGPSMSLVSLLHRIIHLPALIEETAETRHVRLRFNKKDPRMMTKLQAAIAKINRLQIQGPRDKLMHFSLEVAP